MARFVGEQCAMQAVDGRSVDGRLVRQSRRRFAHDGHVPRNESRLLAERADLLMFSQLGERDLARGGSDALDARGGDRL
ncbi:hypothetical protein [Agrococcus sp. KRD186]|uniref:hypothetical protein n=1 Tax=Agrococcus sp. KRD186 TaxID=2729730 RepID=UPI001F4A09BE|nr:hypothetical protein [Agrococcus sp. KRD186]